MIRTDNLQNSIYKTKYKDISFGIEDKELSSTNKLVSIFVLSLK